MKKLLIIPGYKIYPVQNGGSIAQTIFINALCNYYEVHIALNYKNLENKDIFSFEQNHRNAIVHYLESSTKQNNEETMKARILKFIKKTFRLNNWHISKAPHYNKTNVDINNIKSVSAKFNSFTALDFVFSQYIKNIIVKERIDIVQMEMDYNIALALYLSEYNVKKIFVHHELIAEKVIDELTYYSQLPKLYANFLINSVELLETNCLNAYDAVLTFNTADSEILSHKLKKQSIVSPFPVAFQKYNNIFNPNADNCNLIFLGGGDHIPNKHGLEWFIDNVANDLFKEIKSIKLFVTGTWPVSFKNHYKNDQIIFTNFINEKELDSILQNSIVISPIFMGSGLRVKILSAMAKGIPVLSTTKGAAGISNLIHTKNILLADNESEWKQIIQLFINNNEALSTISKNAYELYYQTFNFEELLNTRIAIYQNI